MKDHECGTSKLICINHFTQNDYVISSNGKRIELKRYAVPSIFEVLLIELEDDFENAAENLEEIKLMNSKSPEDSERFKRLNCLHESGKIVINARSLHMSEVIQKQSKEIRDLKRQVEHLKHALDEHKSVDALNVNIFCLVFLLWVVG